MKKFLSMAALLVMAAMCLTACGSDDEPKQNNATATYEMTFSQDVLNNFDVYLVYKAANGRNTPESVNTTNWTKTATCDKLPAEFGVKYIFSPKDGLTLDKEKYDLKVNFKISITKGGTTYTGENLISNSTGLKKEKVLEYMEKLSGKSIGYNVSKSGITENRNLNYDI